MIDRICIEECRYYVAATIHDQELLFSRMFAGGSLDQIGLNAPHVTKKNSFFD